MRLKINSHEVIIPEDILYLNDLEKILQQNDVSLFDTNLIIPAISVRKTGINGKKEFDNYANIILGYDFSVEQCRKITKHACKFQSEYYGKIKSLIDNFPNLITISQVETELNVHKDTGLKLSRIERKDRFLKEKTELLKKYTKGIYNNIESILLKLKERPNPHLSIQGKPVFGRLPYHSWLVAKIRDYSLEHEIPMNGLSTDQHLLAHAIYLSTISGLRVNLISGDHHVMDLFHGTKNVVSYVMGKENKYRGGISNNLVHLLRPKNYDGNIRLMEYFEEEGAESNVETPSLVTLNGGA